MKKDFFDHMIKVLAKNEDVYLLLGDLGYPRYDELKALYPSRVYNCGASEQTMMDMAVGLALSGKTPIVYTITPFLLRAWETIRTYINHEKLHVVMVGAGQNDEYSRDDGFSHFAGDIKLHFDLLKNVKVFSPDTKSEMEFAINEGIGGKYPTFVNIHR